MLTFHKFPAPTGSASLFVSYEVKFCKKMSLEYAAKIFPLHEKEAKK